MKTAGTGSTGRRRSSAGPVAVPRASAAGTSSRSSKRFGTATSGGRSKTLLQVTPSSQGGVSLVSQYRHRQLARNKPPNPNQQRRNHEPSQSSRRRGRDSRFRPCRGDDRRRG